MEAREHDAQSLPAERTCGEVVGMLSQDQWSAIRTLRERGLGNRAIARLLGISVTTVRRYLRQGGRRRYRRRRPVSEQFEQYGDELRRRAAELNFCAQVLFQELRGRGFVGSYQSVKRWMRPLRQTQQRLEKATVRFETKPGRQAQVDWGSTKLWIAGELQRVHLFVKTLGFSRRLFARAYPNERLASLLDGHEQAFRYFGGITDDILYDNPRTIVLRRDRDGRHIQWHPVFKDFADYYGFAPRLCQPYRARTKGKVESGVKYVKHNALVGRSFASWDQLNDWLVTWATTIADQRIHGTTKERPAERFRQEVLRSLSGLAPYRIEREPFRTVSNDCLVALDTNRYSVPWRLVGERVEVLVVGQEVRIHHRGELVATHALWHGRHKLIRQPEHFRGLLRDDSQAAAPPEMASSIHSPHLPAIAEVETRDLSIYEALSEGGAV